MGTGFIRGVWGNFLEFIWELSTGFSWGFVVPKISCSGNSSPPPCGSQIASQHGVRSSLLSLVCFVFLLRESPTLVSACACVVVAAFCVPFS